MRAVSMPSSPQTSPTDTMFLPRRLPPASCAIADSGTSDERDSNCGETRTDSASHTMWPSARELVVMEVESLLVEADQQIDSIALRPHARRCPPAPGTCRGHL